MKSPKTRLVFRFSLFLITMLFVGGTTASLMAQKNKTPQPTYSWSVCIPLDANLNLRGLGTSGICPKGEPGHIYDGSGTRNFVSFINHDYSVFNFEVIYPIQVEFFGIFGKTCGTDDPSCHSMFEKIVGTSGSSLQPDGAYGKRIFFAFTTCTATSCNSYDYQTQLIGSSAPISSYFYIDKELFGDTGFRDYIHGDLISDFSVTRESGDVWHMTSAAEERIDLEQAQTTVETTCTGKRCREVSTREIIADGTASAMKLDVYFIRTLINP